MHPCSGGQPSLIEVESVSQSAMMDARGEGLQVATAESAATTVTKETGYPMDWHESRRVDGGIMTSGVVRASRALCATKWYGI
jgi:hypothetical protein